MKNTIPANYRYTDWDKMELDIAVYTDKLLEDNEWLTLFASDDGNFIEGDYTREDLSDPIYVEITVTGDQFKATVQGEVDVVVEYKLYEFCNNLLKYLRGFNND